MNKGNNIGSEGCQTLKTNKKFKHFFNATAAEAEKVNQFLKLIRANIQQEAVDVNEEEEGRNSNQHSLSEDFSQDVLDNLQAIDLKTTDQELTNDTAESNKSVTDFNASEDFPLPEKLKYRDLNGSIKKEELERCLKYLDKYHLQERRKPFYKRSEKTRKAARSRKEDELIKCTEKELDITVLRPVAVSGATVPILLSDQVAIIRNLRDKSIATRKIPNSFNVISSAGNNSPIVSIPSSINSTEQSLGRASQPIFQARIGTQLCLSLFPYQNVGNVFLSDEFAIFVLQWNPTWLQVPLKFDCPPICDFYPVVQPVYKNERHYYSTYTRLLLLSLWLRLAVSYRWNPVAFKVVCNRVVEGESGCIKIVCHIVLKSTDIQPKKDDVVLCKATDTDGNVHEFFGRLTSVMFRVCDPPAGFLAQDAPWNKYRIQIMCSLAPTVTFKSVIMQIILNLRVALMQNEALQGINESFQAVVLNPRSNRPQLKAVHYEPGQDRKLLSNQILQTLDSNHSPVVLVDTSKMTEKSETISLTVEVAYALSRRTGVLILVCTNSVDALCSLARRLKPYDPVVAIRSRELILGNELKPFTLEELDKKGKISELYEQRRPITLTVFSSFAPQACKQVLVNYPNVVCIVIEAHDCTEPETALPLSFPSVKKLILMGNSSDLVGGLSETLKKYRFHVSLFRRLCVALM